MFGQLSLKNFEGMPKIGIYVMSEVHFTIFNKAWAPNKLFSAVAEVTAK
jgi:hypothetical protein